jgi:peptide/nickel transport system ATP-binding protein
VVAQIADDILVLQQGRTVETGSTEGVLRAPQQDYTRRLVAARSLPKPPDFGEIGQPVLEIDHVSANYRTAHRVLDRISLTLPAGHTLAIVGQSGSGKTTLGRVVIGAHPLSSGSIRFRGELLAPIYTQRRRDQTRRIQIIPQMPDMALNPRQRLKDIVGRPLTLYHGLRGKDLRNAVGELMETVDLDPALGERFPPTISGGQKQRVCIARALAANPDVIICDEPTSALDAIVARSVLELLARLQRQRGLSLLFITHDLNVVKAIAHSVVVLAAGRTVRSGPTDEVLAPPYDRQTARLLNAVPELDPDWLSNWTASNALGQPSPDELSIDQLVTVS